MRNIVTPDPTTAGIVRCDAHHHLFAAGSTAAKDGAEDGVYDVDEFGSDVASVAGVVASVHVQARNHYDASAPPSFAPVGETRWLAALARPPHLVSRCVGFADLTLGRDVGPVLDAHCDAGPGLFAGVRHTAAWSDDPALRVWAGSVAQPGLLHRPEFSLGIAEVHRRGLVFEAWVFAPQLDALHDLARMHPAGVVVIDHLGGPYDTGVDRATMLERWRAAMTKLARLDHVRVKLSGIGMPLLTPPGRITGAIDAERVAAYWAPELQWCVETFGPDRCLLGSNFPVDRALCDYATLWAAFDLVIADYSTAEQELLRRGTATGVYAA